ncbi:MAG TPA: toll/interleukin-1 receptor domain-containing protein [Blastocatellia bacterium]|nr:toll/interleukin-1 receptor domain-containing protein [Blastocatellia bacterium]HMV87014.1 toll/interleukin-1 receptor domain-containing protein [Blastocatellia bacterium]HMX29857.1 toll/interleukin-1 receptor domain-containing protein [Blastocatellia bacterium]HMY71648.1 toll/interleukin-1 receptor domain-containing protein [Blastocatellia bacterium]HMZ19390.1 toll/interleukin-1 receptor domain-containing protein [Blastocatellia bacterium]
MQVFISHSGKEPRLARRLATILRQAGFRVWDAYSNLYPGDNWAKLTAQALEESQAMVVLLTPESLESRWVQSEIEYALGNKNYAWRLIPVLVGDPKQFQKDQIPWILQELQMVILPEPENGDAELAQVVEVLKRPLDFVSEDFKPAAGSVVPIS